MNVRLKLANNEQKTCTIKMAENSSVVGADRIVEEAGADLVENDIEEICTTAEVGKTETVSVEENDKESTTTGCEHPESESEDSTDEKDDDVVCEESSPKQNKNIEHKVNASEGLINVNDPKTDEEKQI